MSKVLCFCNHNTVTISTMKIVHISFFVWIAARSLLSKTADARLARLLAQQRQGHWRAEDSSPTGHSHCIFGRRWTIHLQNPIPVCFFEKKKLFYARALKKPGLGLTSSAVVPDPSICDARMNNSCGSRSMQWTLSLRASRSSKEFTGIQSELWEQYDDYDFFTHFVTVAACFL